eukprot:6213546-Pleurochrysis_carterae.AAC.3
MATLVAQRGQVSDVGGEAKPLIQVGCRAFVALRIVSTQRSAGHAETEKEEGDVQTGRAPSSEGCSRVVAGDGGDGASGTCVRRRSPWETGDRSRGEPGPVASEELEESSTEVAGSLEGNLRGQNRGQAWASFSCNCAASNKQPTRTMKARDSRKGGNEENKGDSCGKTQRSANYDQSHSLGERGCLQLLVKDRCSKSGPQIS